MKLNLYPFALPCAFALLMFATSCTKDAVQAPETTNKVATISSLTNEANGLKKLTLQPGTEDGDDTWLAWKSGDAYTWWANTNFDTVNTLYAYAWTDRGVPIRARSLIKFDGLSVIPTTAKVVSARLYMYGVPSSTQLTQGNSIYPGTPYTEDNSVTVLRVIQPWNHTTATWNNQPKVTLANRSVIAASTAQWNYDASVDVTPMVAHMINQPKENYGFMLRMAVEEVYKSMLFTSSNYNDPKRRPKLVVTYQ